MVEQRIVARKIMQILGVSTPALPILKNLCGNIFIKIIRWALLYALFLPLIFPLFAVTDTHTPCDFINFVGVNCYKSSLSPYAFTLPCFLTSGTLLRVYSTLILNKQKFESRSVGRLVISPSAYLL